MKNKIFIIFLSCLLNFTNLFAEDILIKAQDITLDKEKKTSIFKKNVSVETQDKKITSQFAEYNKIKEQIILKKEIIAQDKFENKIETDYATYDNLNNIFKTEGSTTLITSKNYKIKGADIKFDGKNKIIKSDKVSILTDLSGNKIYLENFEYLSAKKIFKSIGLIKIIDQYENTYEFSQLYIDTEKRKYWVPILKLF